MRPSPVHSIDRIDNDSGYSPDNCRWATNFDQARNKRNNVHVVVNGERMVVAQAERAIGIGHGSINQRARKRGESYQAAADHFAQKYAPAAGG